MGAYAGATLGMLWMLGLWYVAPLIDREPLDIAARIRNVLALGAAIPLALGLLGILYPATCILALGLLAILRVRATRPAMIVPTRGLLAALAFVALIAWPYLIEPLMDGDSLLYHLPNAASWVQTHSVWQTTTHEWFYPPGSELFAAPFLAFGARFSLWLCGAAAMVLLVARLTIWGTELGAPLPVCALCVFALVTTPIVAFETGTLQNDVWIAAFFIEALYLARKRQAWVALAMCGMLKPFGFLYAGLAALYAKRMSPLYVAALAAPAVWVLRDVVLFPHQSVAPQATTSGLWHTTIAAHLPDAFASLVAGLPQAGAACVFFLALPLGGLFFPRLRSIAIAGCAAVAIYTLLPMGYGDAGVNYLAAGSSLRFAIPALAVGALLLCVLAAEAPLAVGAISLGLVVTGMLKVSAAFAADQPTAWALPVASILAAVALVDRSRFRLALLATICVVIATGTWFTSNRAARFYSYVMAQPDGTPTAAFAWLASHHPERVATWNIRGGLVIMASPQTQVTEANPESPCEASRGTLLVAGTERGTAQDAAQRALRTADRCGKPLFADRVIHIVEIR